MAQPVQCRLCSDNVAYHPDLVYQLGEHLLEQHPMEGVAHYSFDGDRGDGLRVFRPGEDDFEDCIRRKKTMYKTTGLQTSQFKAYSNLTNYYFSRNMGTMSFANNLP